MALLISIKHNDDVIIAKAALCSPAPGRALGALRVDGVGKHEAEGAVEVAALVVVQGLALGITLVVLVSSHWVVSIPASMGK